MVVDASNDTPDEPGISVVAFFFNSILLYKQNMLVQTNISYLCSKSNFV
jgi:hypothetical protein